MWLKVQLKVLKLTLEKIYCELGKQFFSSSSSLSSFTYIIWRFTSFDSFSLSFKELNCMILIFSLISDLMCRFMILYVGKQFIVFRGLIIIKKDFLLPTTTWLCHELATVEFLWKLIFRHKNVGQRKKNQT